MFVCPLPGVTACSRMSLWLCDSDEVDWLLALLTERCFFLLTPQSHQFFLQHSPRRYSPFQYPLESLAGAFQVQEL
jgi:hypothetical protein